MFEMLENNYISMKSIREIQQRNLAMKFMKECLCLRHDIVIMMGSRTPFAKAEQVVNVSPTELGRHVLRELIAKTQLDVNTVDEVIIGTLGTRWGSNISRVFALEVRIPQKVSAIRFIGVLALESLAQGLKKIRSEQWILFCWWH